MACASSLALGSQTLRQVLLMCQLRHPNIISAEDIYLPSDIPVEHRDNGMRLQRSNTDHICVHMPYYPADMAWLIHSSPQVLTYEHVQVALQPCCDTATARHSLFGLTRPLQYICVQILRGLRCRPPASCPCHLAIIICDITADAAF